MPVADFAQGVKSPFFSMVNHTSDGSRMKLAAKASPTNLASTAAATKTATASSDGKSFLDDMLDIVNPLQHLPIVGTVYRAITGDKIGDVEKVAGDTLYGGPIGLASSLADVAFEKITGKDFGSTMLAMVGIGDNSDTPTALASNTKSANTPKAESAKTAALNTASLIVPPAAKIAQTATAAPAKLAPPTTAPAANTTTASVAAQTPVDISPQTDALLASLQRNGVTGAMQTQAMDAYRRTMTMGAQPTGTVH